MILLLLLGACTGDVGDTEPTGSSPDTDTPPTWAVLSHAVDIQPLWTTTCAVAGCHIQEDGRVMSLEEGLAWNNLVDRASSQFPLYDLVEPGNPQGSYLTHKLAGTHNDVGGMGRQMPTGKDPLTDDEQLRIQEWIAQGAPP